LPKKVGIIDYKLSNIYSVYQACKFVGLTPKLISKPSDFESFDALIIPGVGSFPKAMENLRKQNLLDKIKEFAALNYPILGICLGMQLLFTLSYELKKCKGLNLIKGKVIKFDKKKLVVPHIGWNTFKIFKNESKNNIFKNIPENSFMYFVHSYYVVPEDKKGITALSKYGNQVFCSSYSKDNIYAMQFHPEKSSKQGIQIYKNFKQII
tara:strand:- start:110 stop:736 length:627 start_codon:yes stop_codon:yes gene_type:complete